MITSVLFDLDGTLIDSWRLYMEAYTRTFEECYGRPFDRSETLELLGRRPRSETWLLRNLLGPDAQLDAFELFLAQYRSLHDSHFDGPYDGILDMLRELRRQRYALGIVTGKSREAWTITETQAGLVPFDVVVTESDIATPKPDPEGLLKALSLLGREIGETLYIGDSLPRRRGGAGDRHGLLGGGLAQGAGRETVVRCIGPGDGRGSPVGIAG